MDLNGSDDNVLPDWVKPGVSFHYFKRKYHVRGVVDGMAILREWRPSKKYWVYTVEDPAFFDVADKYISRGGQPAVIPKGRLGHDQYGGRKYQ